MAENASAAFSGNLLVGTPEPALVDSPSAGGGAPPSSSSTPESPPPPHQPPDRRAQTLLLASVFAVAACGLVYELVLGAVGSYLLGDAVTQFSLVLGVFLSSMGLGSYLAQFLRRRLLTIFVELEIWIGLLGGISSIFLFAVYAFLPEAFSPLFYTLCATLGALVGVEIPLLVRILRGEGAEEGEGTVHQALSQVLALDYIGALAGAVAFPFLALPWLGLSRSSIVFGLMNLAVAAAGVTLIRGRRTGTVLRLVAAFAVLLVAVFASGRLVGFLEDLLYQDSVIYARDTPYQRIVVTRWRDDTRLYLNGHLQFSTIDEARYHEALVVPAMEAAEAGRGGARRVLVLGGGDGLAARRILAYPGVESVVIVDIDPAVTELARTRRELTAANGDALADPRVRIVHQDALTFLEADRSFYDVILADLPDPSTSGLSKLYSRAFYRMALRRLSESGAFATQATSPFYAREAYWSIAATLESVASAPAAPGRPGPPERAVYPYHADVPSFGDWGFLLATGRAIDPAALPVSIETDWLTPDLLPTLFTFGKDIARPDETPINRLDAPVLYRLYEQGWERFQG